MGYNGSVLSFGTGSYPIIGGAIAMIGWNYPFLLAALAFPVGLLVLYRLDNPEPRNSQQLFTYLKSAFKLMKNRRVITLYFSILSTFILLYGVLIAYYPFLMKTKFNSSSLLIGVIISAASLASGIGEKLAGERGRLECAFLSFYPDLQSYSDALQIGLTAARE